MRTLLVGDLHLKSQIILPMVEEKINELNCQRVILLGDYMDASGQTSNTKLYASDLLYLIEWKKKMVDKGIEVVTLLGNHDAPYLIEIPADFSASDEDLFFAISDSLYELGVQVAYKLDDYLVSHAGVVEDFELEDWYFHPLSISDMSLIEKMQGHVGFLRGGNYSLGSPLWADYNELKKLYNKNLPKQIFGHTPQSRISLDSSLIGIDTFAISLHFDFRGNGDLLLYDSGELSVVKTNWGMPGILEKIKASFHI